MKIAVTLMPNDLLQILPDNPEHAMQVGQQYMVEVHPKADRSAGHHRKFWAMLRFFADFLEHPMSDESLKQWAVIGAGYFDVAPDGALLAHSIAFDKMPQAEFERLYSNALDFLLRTVGPADMTEEDVQQALAFA
jgi:hypothetical protein